MITVTRTWRHRRPDGSIAEIFLNTAKYGTALDVNVRDAAISASLLLCNTQVATLRHALTRNADGSAGGALARALDILEGAVNGSAT